MVDQLDSSGYLLGNADNDMIAGEVVEIVSRINFEKGVVPLKVLSLSHNDIVCDNLKYFRGAFLNYLMMLYLGISLRR